jgi:O-antigen/teichoic acid export membrane protein
VQAAIPFIYGSVYTESVLPFLIMLPGIVAVGSYMVVEPYFRALGRPLVPVKISFVGLTANLALSLLLIPNFGIIGASIAYTVSYLVQMLFVCQVFHVSSELPWFTLLDIKKGLAESLELGRNLLHNKRTRSINLTE